MNPASSSSNAMRVVPKLDGAAALALFVSHLPYAAGITRQWIARSPSLRPHEEDLLQEASIGLLVAARRFRPARGVLFRTYAWWWVTARIRREAQRLGAALPAFDEGFQPTADGSGLHPIESAVEVRRLLPRMARLLRRAHRRTSPSAGSASRNVELFLRSLLHDESLADLGRAYSLSRERARQLHQRMGLLFERCRLKVLTNERGGAE